MMVPMNTAVVVVPAEADGSPKGAAEPVLYDGYDEAVRALGFSVRGHVEVLARTDYGWYVEQSAARLPPRRYYLVDVSGHVGSVLGPLSVLCAVHGR